MRGFFYISLIILAILMVVWASLPTPKPTTTNRDLDYGLLLEAAERRLELFEQTRAQRHDILTLELAGYGERRQAADLEAHDQLNQERSDLQWAIADLRSATLRP